MVEDLAAVEADQGHLGRPGEVEVVGRDRVGLLAVRGELAGAGQRLLPDQRGHADQREVLVPGRPGQTPWPNSSGGPGPGPVRAAACGSPGRGRAARRRPGRCPSSGRRPSPRPGAPLSLACPAWVPHLAARLGCPVLFLHRGELAALGHLVPDVQPDDPVRLGPGGFQPGPDVSYRGHAVVDLVQDGFRRRPEHRGQRVAGREQPAPDAGQRAERFPAGATSSASATSRLVNALSGRPARSATRSASRFTSRSVRSLVPVR
jgi:hypothetical protein